MTLSTTANFFAQTYARTLLITPPMHALVYWGASGVISLSCVLLYTKLSGEKGMDPILNFMVSLGPAIALPYVLDWLEEYYRCKARCGCR
jgi:hypothetical protein